eukprot:GILI01017815.1.p1 GENE.GILI01017815.1~~GILI01017815.1.p1  ORF type:complete len:697 (+),score=126.99 GILI01017815.1:245-2092(+)
MLPDPQHMAMTAAIGSEGLSQEPASPTTVQQLTDMLIPDEISKTASGNTDLIRAKESIAGSAVVDRFDIGRGHGVYTPPDPRMDGWFEGYTVRSQLLCASCNATLGWRFGRGPRLVAIVVPTEAPKESPSVSGSADGVEPSSAETQPTLPVIAQTTLVPANIRANPFGPSPTNTSTVGLTTSATATTTTTTTTAIAAAPLPVGHYGFMALTLKNVKHRSWTGRDIARQCLVAAAVARRQALEMLQMSSPSAIAVASNTASPTVQEPQAASGSATAANGSFPTTIEQIVQARRIAIAEEEAQRLVRIHAILDEDTVSRRRLESLMNTKINEAVEERTRNLKTQAELVISLLEKHKEQTSVLSQLLKGQKDKLRTQEDKINTYEQIFNAHKRQLDTQTKHITFQDDLMRTLKVQAECQQKQIESQQTILREQNGTIHKQNGHVREMQTYLRSLVESQVRIKSYLETISERDSAAEEEPAGGELSPANEGQSPSSDAGEDINDVVDRSTTTVDHSAQPPKIVSHNAESSMNAAGQFAPPDNNNPSPNPLHRLAVAGGMARLMLADLAKHESEFGVDYSSLDGRSIAGQAIGLGRGDDKEGETTHTDDVNEKRVDTEDI